MEGLIALGRERFNVYNPLGPPMSRIKTIELTDSPITHQGRLRTFDDPPGLGPVGLPPASVTKIRG